MPHTALAQRLNRHTPSGAHVRFEGLVPFGAALSVERYELANGLEVLLLPDAESPVVAYHTWFRVGSRHEEAGKTGLAHFFEHMMFNETANLPWGEFDRRMEAAGGDTNAATWIDWTYYHQALPADEVGLAIQLEADRMANLVVRKPQIESEREVVANERRMAVEDDVRGAADERLWALAFGPKHPHGWPTIGWMEDIEGYRVTDCRAFYKRWYRPSNATVVVAGGLDRRRVLSQVQRHYGSIRRGASKADEAPTRPRRPAQRAERRATLEWPTAAEKLCLGWHAPPFTHPDFAALEVVDELLTGGRSARLYRDLVEERELCTRVRGGVSDLTHGGLFDLWISMREGVPAARALERLDVAVERLVKEPVSEEELDKVKSRIELFFLSAIETADGKAGQIGHGRAVAGDAAYAFRRLAALRSVSAPDVARVSREWLRPSRRSIVHVVSDGSAS